MQKLKAPKGTADILPEQWIGRSIVEAAATGIMQRAGYGRIETPTFESTDLFVRGVGESTDVVQKEMYTFTDGGERSMTLRPEGTASICRSYIEHGMHKQPQPVKLWYYGSFYRYEAPQAGRYRQFWQIGTEALGSQEPALDAESITLLAELLEALSIQDVKLRLGTLGSSEPREHYRQDLITYLKQNSSRLAPQVQSRIELNPLRAFDSDDQGTQEVMAAAPLLKDYISEEDSDHFRQVCELLDAIELKYVIDPTLVRGLDYYSRTVFEFTSAALGAQSGVGGGGRYDGLVHELGGQQTPAVGWASGVERLLLASSGVGDSAGGCDLYIAGDDASSQSSLFKTAYQARAAGLSVQQELAGRSKKGQLKQADRCGARYLLLISADQAEIKDMEAGQWQKIDLSSAVAELQKLIKKDVE